MHLCIYISLSLSVCACVDENIQKQQFITYIHIYIYGLHWVTNASPGLFHWPEAPPAVARGGAPTRGSGRAWQAMSDGPMTSKSQRFHAHVVVIYKYYLCVCAFACLNIYHDLSSLLSI